MALRLLFFVALPGPWGKIPLFYCQMFEFKHEEIIGSMIICLIRQKWGNDLRYFPVKYSLTNEDDRVLKMTLKIIGTTKPAGCGPKRTTTDYLIIYLHKWMGYNLVEFSHRKTKPYQRG